MAFLFLIKIYKKAMKLLSLNYLFTKAKESLFRFPIVLICSFLGVLISVYLVEMEHEIKNKLPYINVLLTSALGVPLFFCIKIYSEKINLKKKSLTALLYLFSFFFLKLCIQFFTFYRRFS